MASGGLYSALDVPGFLFKNQNLFRSLWIDLRRWYTKLRLISLDDAGRNLPPSTALSILKKKFLVT